MLTLDLLRHGALEGGIKYRGRVDDPLTEQGRSQMDRVWQSVAHEVDCLFASPLSRCAEPATAWGAKAGIACIIEDRLAEMDYGRWEGKTIPEIQQGYPGMLDRWRADPTGMRPPDGESPEELRARLAEWWEEISEHYSGQHLLVVAHSGSLRMLIALLLEQPIAYTRQLDMPYAVLHRIVSHQGRNSLKF